MKTIQVRITHPASCQKVGAVFEVEETTVVGELTGRPLYKIVGSIERIDIRFCEVI